MDTSLAAKKEGTEQITDCVIVGGCSGLFLVPSAHELDFYRGQGRVAVLGLACLLGFVLLQCVS
jgi:hypothetical protein